MPKAVQNKLLRGLRIAELLPIIHSTRPVYIKPLCTRFEFSLCINVTTQSI